jgi:hypothetical protein
MAAPENTYGRHATAVMIGLVAGDTPELTRAEVIGITAVA